MVRTSVTATVLSCLTIYYLLGLWFHKNDSPLDDLDANLAGGLTPTKKFSQRIVAIGDLHGDLPHALRALRLAGLVDHRNKWIGRRAVLVQTGDVLDRGKDTIALYHLFDQLRVQARQVGGDVLSLLGNHEYMNALGDWRYVTDDEIATFHGERNRRKAISGDGWIGRTWLDHFNASARVSYADAFVPFPDLPLSNYKRDQQTFVPAAAAASTEEGQDSLEMAAASFVHGGISADWAQKGTQRINEVGHSLLSKAIDTPYLPLNALPRNTTVEEEAFYGDNGPLWYRGFALEDNEQKVCEQAEEVRRLLGVRRLVMGHTANLGGIRSRCKGRVLLIDTGITRAYGGRISALEISYHLAPVLPAYPDGTYISLPNPSKGDKTQRWRESEVIAALYEGQDKELVVRSDRVVTLPIGDQVDEPEEGEDVDEA